MLRLFLKIIGIHTSSNEAVRKSFKCQEILQQSARLNVCWREKKLSKRFGRNLLIRKCISLWKISGVFLFMTGISNTKAATGGSHYKLAIPNLEVRDIFKTQIMEYFKEGVAKDGDTLKQLCDALKGGDAEKVERLFEGYLKKTISIRDTFVEKSLKENFYHGILLGILGVKEDWGVFSNRETGDGYSDIMIETEDSEMGIIIEIKYAGDGNLLNACEKALKQVEETKYEETLLENGVEKILKYGIACYMKHCKVMCSER